MSEIYSPEEDSYLISDSIKKEIESLKNLERIKFLEVGSGSGINLQTAASCGIKKESIFSLDINSDAVKKCKSLGFNCIKSDLFEKLNEKDFDLIVFNPPYLPEDDSGLESKSSELITTGGKEGSEIIIKFLKQAKDFLSKKGKIILLTSSLTPKINFKSLGYESRIINRKKIFFEELFVWKLKLI